VSRDHSQKQVKCQQGQVFAPESVAKAAMLQMEWQKQSVVPKLQEELKEQATRYATKELQRNT
jgi:hypothetical protein